VTRVKAAVFLVLCTLFWAGNNVIGAEALDSIDPISLSWTRWLLAAVPLVVAAQLIERPDWHDALRSLPMLGLLGLLGMTGFAALLYIALEFTSPLNASLINGLGPMVTVALAAILPAAWQGGRRERITLRTAACLLLGLAGAIIVLTDGDVGALLRTGVNPGDLVMLLVISSFAFYTLLGRRVTHIPAITSVSIQTAAAVVLTAPLLLINGLHWPTDPPGWGELGYIVLFPSIGSYVLWNAAVKRVPASTAAIYLNLMVVFPALLGLPFGYGITWAQVIGGVLVITAVILLTRARSATPVSREPDAPGSRLAEREPEGPVPR